MGGFGTGMAIGIGGALLERLTTPHPSGGQTADRPSVKKTKATATQQGKVTPAISRRDSNGKSTAQAPERGGNSGRSGVPPRGERRYVPDEVLTQFSPDTSQQSIDQIARRYSLTLIEFAELSVAWRNALSLAS